MLRRILCYCGVFLLTLYCFFMYDDKSLHTMLIVEVVYFGLSILSLCLVRNNISVSLISHSAIAEKNSQIPITILVNNQSILPVVHFDIVLKLENSFTGEMMKHRVHGRVFKNKEKRVVVPIKIKECGNLKITLKRIEIYDALFILKKFVRLNDTGYIGVLPECTLIPIEISRKTREFIADAEEYSDRESGDDSSEIYQIREYRLGDSVHDIHWKLSAKADELLVKENGKPLGAAVLVWLDLEKCKGNMAEKRSVKGYGQKKMITKMFDVAASISISLLEEKCVHIVAWYEVGNKVIHKKRISKEEHLYELLYRLLYVENYDNSEEVRVQFKDEFKGVEFSSIIELKMNGTISIGEQEINVPIQKNKVNFEQLYLKV